MSNHQRWTYGGVKKQHTKHHIVTRVELITAPGYNAIQIRDYRHNRSGWTATPRYVVLEPEQAAALLPALLQVLKVLELEAKGLARPDMAAPAPD